MLEQLTGKALRLLQEYLPSIQQLIAEKAPEFIKSNGVKGMQFLTHNDRLRPLFETVYQSLPMPLRVLVKQETFVAFCLDRKEDVLGNWLPAPKKTTAQSARPASPKKRAVRKTSKEEPTAKQAKATPRKRRPKGDPDNHPE